MPITVNSRLVALIVAAVAIGATAVPSSSSRAQAPNAARASTGLIAGQLVDGESGRPVSTATVSLAPVTAAEAGRAGGPAPPRTPPAQVLTDANGHFVFHSLPAGTYSVNASRAGYGPSTFGQTDPEGGSSNQRRRIELAEGQRLTDVAIRIWKLASISGRLLDEAGEPAVGATVALLRVIGSGSARQFRFVGNNAETNDRGMFRFSELASGDYLVFMPSTVVSVPTSVLDAYLDARASGPAGENQLTRDVRDSGGSVPSSGKRIGDVLIEAGQGPGMPQVIEGTGGAFSVYPVTFYPGVRQLASATVVNVRVGQERTGVDFSVRPVPAVAVAGRVTSPDGNAANLTVKFAPTEFESGGLTDSIGPRGYGDVAMTITRADGTFTAIGIPAGSYTASILKVPSPVRAPSGPNAVISVGGGTASFGGGSNQPVTPSSEPIVWARTPVSVADANVDGVALALAYGATVSGRVEFEPGSTPAPSPEQMQRSRVVLSPVGGTTIIRAAPPTLGADGTFKTQGYVPGRYYLSLSPGLPNWTIKSITVGGRNMLNMPLDLSGGDLTGVVITYTDKVGEVSGSVTGGEADLLVLLIPANYQGWIQGGMSVGAVRSVSLRDGAFQLQGILPGDYVLVAVSAATIQDSIANPQMMASIARQGTRVSVTDKGKQTVILKAIQGRRP